MKDLRRKLDLKRALRQADHTSAPFGRQGLIDVVLFALLLVVVGVVAMLMLGPGGFE